MRQSPAAYNSPTNMSPFNTDFAFSPMARPPAPRAADHAPACWNVTHSTDTFSQTPPSTDRISAQSSRRIGEVKAACLQSRCLQLLPSLHAAADAALWHEARIDCTAPCCACCSRSSAGPAALPGGQASSCAVVWRRIATRCPAATGGGGAGAGGGRVPGAEPGLRALQPLQPAEPL